MNSLKSNQSLETATISPTRLCVGEQANYLSAQSYPFSNEPVTQLCELLFWGRILDISITALLHNS